MKSYFDIIGNQVYILLRGLITLSILLYTFFLSFQTPMVPAIDDGCRTDGPASAQYTITLCFSAPTDGAILSGSQTVSVTSSTSGTTPGISRIIFYLEGEYLLMDFQAPYSFSLPSNHWVDGIKLLEVEALMKDGFTSSRAAINITFQNNVTIPPVNTNTFTPSGGTNPQSGGPFILAATGDGAGGMTSYGFVTDLINLWNPNMVLYVGDVYQKGTSTEFLNWYGSNNTFLGRFRAITNPAIGNHEYENGIAPGYFDYWDNIPNYYSYSTAGWHFISLNSNCGLNKNCAVGQTQYQWLQNDLNTNPNICTIAYFHHPPYSIGPEGYTTQMNDMWALMAQAGVDIVITGHDHNYQRWLPLDENGAPTTNGITEFVVGAGGHGTQTFITTDNRLAIGFDTTPYSFGALRLRLNQDGAGYQYINIQGAVLDSGAIPCSGAPADTTAPGAPTNLTASVYSAIQTNLAWADSNDNVGIAGYDIYRNGALAISLGMVNSFHDTNLPMGVTYNYQVQARDAAGNISDFSNLASVTLPQVLFSDGFESGNLSLWTSNVNLEIQQQEHYAGLNAIQAISVSGAIRQTYLSKTLSATQTNLYYSTSFEIRSLGTSTVYLQRFRNSTNGAILGVYVNASTRKLGYRNDTTASSVTNGPVISLNVWHKLQTHVKINGANSLVEIWLDDVQVASLSKTDALGTNPIGRLQLGDNSGTAIYNVVFDEVSYNTSFINTTDAEAPTIPPNLNANATAPNSVTLTWSTSTDNRSVTGYDLFRNNIFLATVGTVTSYEDTPVSPEYTYQYQVRARDAAENVSDLGSPAEVITPADTTPPTVMLTSLTDGMVISGNQFLTADAADNVNVEYVNFWVNDSLVMAQSIDPYEFTWDSTSLPDGTLAVITAQAFDSSQNQTTSLSRTVTVNNSNGDSTSPSQPGNFTATAGGASRVDLLWEASTDNLGVTAYDIYRNGNLLASVGSVTSYSDSTVVAGETHLYQIQARDAAGNVSGLASAATLVIPAVLFSTGFESGDLSQWLNNGLSIEQQNVFEGIYAARATGNGSVASYAYLPLSTPRSDLYYNIWFKILNQGLTSAYLQRFRTSSNGSILGVFVSSTGRLGYRNDMTATSLTSSTTVSRGTWHQLQTRLHVNGVNSRVEIWLDGVLVSALSRTETFGTTPIGRIQLSDNQIINLYDLAFDKVSFDTSFIQFPAQP